MFGWFKKKVIEKKPISGGGIEEKRHAIEIQNSVAEDVIKRMGAIKNNRRHHLGPFDGQDRRLHLA